MSEVIKIGVNPDPNSLWCYNCKKEVKSGYTPQPNGIIDCPLCKRGTLTKYRDKVFRAKRFDIKIKWLDSKYLEPVKKTENHKAKIAAGVVAFNDALTIPRMMDSLADFDYVIVCEGKYDVNPNGQAHSTDGTLEILRQYPNVIILDCAGMRQSDARNLYLKKAQQLGCTYLLVIECDEYVTGDMQEFRDSLPTHGKSGPDKTVYNTYMHYVPNHVVQSPRFFYGLSHIRYGKTHSTYIIDGIEYLATNGDKRSDMLLPGIMVNHDETPRTQEQQEKAEEYQNALVKQEKQERTRLKEQCKFL